MPKVFSLEAKVHKQIGDAYRVKVSILDLGMYINGMMVFPPNDEHDWAVYPPAQRAGRGKYAYIVEFNKKMPLWSEVYDACIDAVKLELPSPNYFENDGGAIRPFFQDGVIENIPDEPINLDDIPF